MRKPLSRAYNRDVSRRKAQRKKKISDQFFYDGHSWYDCLHKYSKGKIHCSCGMCRRKTKNKGSNRTIHGNYAPSRNYCVSDLRKIQLMDISEQDYFDTSVE